MSTFKELEENLKNALTNLGTLDIITVVGNVKYNSGKQDRSFAPDSRIMRTRIDLIQGDIITEIDQAFVTGEYQGLREFHVTREKQGSDIIKGNIAVIERLFETLAKLAEQRQTPSSPAAPALPGQGT
jgi:hypothetical protein